MAASLLALLAEHLPRGFVDDLIKQSPLTYAEALSSVKDDPRFEAPEVCYMHAPTRRALFQVMLRKLAKAHDLDCEMSRIEGAGGPEFVVINVGPFRFTTCHIQTPNSFPHDSRHREQYALINEHIAQTQLFPIRSEPSDADLYGVIVHCESYGDKGLLGTLAIGFPNKDYDYWAEEPIALAEIARVQREVRKPFHNIDAAPKPRWKQDKKTDTSGEA